MSVETFARAPGQTWESYDAVFCNYFSFGVDAVAASAFHRHRENHPHLFTSRLR
ncbi:unnamed protein product [Hapterophycus canaliculatus]